MAKLIVGATGATGRLLVQQLLDRGQNVRAIMRSPDKIPEDIKYHDRLSIIHASVLDLSDAEMGQYVEGCDAVASCLGHNLNWRGIYGRPRWLVTDTIRRLSDSVKANKPKKRIRFVLMNTAGNRNQDLQEQISFSQKCAVGIIRLLLPPHTDNEKAADYLRTQIGQNDETIGWVVVRPDTLTNEDHVTKYSVHASPTRSGIFYPGKTSRINVAHFMAGLMMSADTWHRWSGQMPVIYNQSSCS